MRFWHPKILQELPKKNLLTLHMNLCRIRRKAWGKPTSKTWYYNLSWRCFVWYHSLIIKEMAERGWNPTIKWLSVQYRGNLPLADIEDDVTANYLNEFERIWFDTVEKQKKQLKQMRNKEMVKKSL